MNPLPVQILGAATLYTAEEMAGAADIDPFIFQGSHPESNVFLFFSSMHIPPSYHEPACTQQLTYNSSISPRQPQQLRRKQQG